MCAFKLFQVVIAAFTSGQLLTWHFKTGDVVRETDLGASPSFLLIHRNR